MSVVTVRLQQHSFGLSWATGMLDRLMSWINAHPWQWAVGSGFVIGMVAGLIIEIVLYFSYRGWI